MRIIIYYFTGTGNSLRAARLIAKELGQVELVSMKENVDLVPAVNADMIGFVSPVYEWDIPDKVKSFVESLELNPNAYIFMVATYVMNRGRCFQSLDALLRRKSAHISYARMIRCVGSQCVSYPPFPPEKLMVPHSDRAAVRIGKEVAGRVTNKYPRVSFATKVLHSKLIKPYTELQREYDKGFYTTEDCIGCKLCSKVCPVQNITFEDGHPVFHQLCLSCNACVVYCPKRAIQYKRPAAYDDLHNFFANRLCLPEKRKRYHNPYIKAEDLIRNREMIHLER